MKDFLETIKNIPQIFKYAFKVYKDAFRQSGFFIIGFLFLSILLNFVPYFRNWSQGLLINSLQQNFIFDKNIQIIFALFVGLIILPGFLQFIKDFFNRTYRFKLNQYYENRFTEKSIEIDPQHHENKDFNNLQNRITSKGTYVMASLQIDSWSLLLDLSSLILVSITLYHFSPRGFFVIILTTLPLLVVNIMYGKDSWFIWGNDVDTEKRNRYWEYKNYFEKFSSYIELKLSESKEYFRLFRSNFLQDVFNNQFKNEKSLVKKSFLVNLISQAGIIYVIYFLILKVSTGELLIGSFIFAVSLITTFSLTLISIFTTLSMMYPDYKYVKDFFTFLNLEPIIKNSGVKSIDNNSPTIEFKNVSFKYPDTENYVLKNFNLKIEQGGKIAIIGLNGAGKTTFVKLLCRFYDVDEGEILLNEINIKEYDLESWYNIIGVLFQEYGKYHIPLDELIALGRYTGKVDERKVKEVLRIAEAQFVDSLPQKEKTMLGKHYTDGVDISVGQWQKLAIARMFYRDPAVMILDEPTSSIDAEAESKIFETLEKLSKEKTVIMISHRFSTVRNADKICVIKDGTVHELGTHEELIANKSEYARLFSLQAEGYK